MKTFSANSIAEQFERDRGVVVRALRNTKPDAMVSGKPQWKVATASRALEAHNRAAGNGGGGDVSRPPEFDVFDRAFDRMTALPTLAKRRAAAVKLIPVIDAMMAAMRAHGLANREDPDVTGMRADRIYTMTLALFRVPCQWDHDEVWNALCVEPD